jgi:hypothetical protein
MGSEKICVRGTIITIAASSESDQPVAEVVLVLPLEEARELASMLYIPAVLEISPEPQPEPKPGKPRLRTVR